MTPGGKPRIVPMPGKIAVRLAQDERIGRLYVPPSAQRQRSLGTIVALGDDEEEGDYYDLQVGDQVVFGAHSGVRVNIDQDEIVIFRVNEILCKLVTEDTPRVEEVTSE